MRFTSLLVIAAAIAGCTVGPDYKKPELAVPQAWSAGASGDVARRWWTLFKDPALDALVNRAVAANLDVKIALARVREARAMAAAAGAAQLPSVDVSGSASRLRTTMNGLQPDFGQDFENTDLRVG